MKYLIVCDKPSRLRVRFGKYIFTKEQCYGLCDLLLFVNGVEKVFANEINGSVLIEYTGKSAREEVLNTLSSLSLCQIKDGSPSEEERAKIPERQLKIKIFKHCAWYFAGT